MQSEAIRKNWLMSFFVYYIGIAIFSYLDILLFIDTFNPSDILVADVSIFIFTGILAKITYHCAYKKQGTMWLTFQIVCMFLGAVRFVYNIPAQLTEYYTFSPLFLHVLVPIKMARVLLVVYYWYNSDRLRSLNRALQNNKTSVSALS